MGKYGGKSLSYTNETNLANSLSSGLNRVPANFNPKYTKAADLKKYGNALLNKLKNAGFSKGGVVSDLNKIALANGDDGWATLKRGESVLTPEQTEQLQRLTDNLMPLNTMVENIGLLNNNALPKVQPQNNVSTTAKQVDIHLDGSNVVDPDSFIKTLHNPRVLKEVSNGVSSQLGTTMSNKLGRF